MKDKKQPIQTSLTGQDEKDIKESFNDAGDATISDLIPDSEAEFENDALANVEHENHEIANLYGNNYANAGTEDVSQADLNTPTLKVVQDNTKNLPDKIPGFFHRSDTNEQKESYDVNFVSVNTREMENYKKDAVEQVKVYFGFYAGTNEPFKMFIRGMSLSSHRMLQSEILTYKNRFRVPMFALTVRLTTKQVVGKTKENVDYDIRKILFQILKDPKDQSRPIIETDPGRIGFLLEAVERFKIQAQTVQMDEQA